MPFAAYAVLVGTFQVKESLAPPSQSGASLASAVGIAQFCFVNEYGLFRQMTETRPELIVEGSSDGMDWTPYEFHWKPGNPAERPRFCQPHQPRLDWQMWFEALRLEQVHAATGTISPRYMSAWFQSFLSRLLAGEPVVVGLLARNPFPNGPPKYVGSRSTNTGSRMLPRDVRRAIGGTASAPGRDPVGRSRSKMRKSVLSRSSANANEGGDCAADRQQPQTGRFGHALSDSA